MSRRLLITLLVLLFSAPFVALAQDDMDFSEEDTRFELVYAGEFIDQGNEPISGTFPLSFKLYRSAKAKKSLWKENHFVSVVDGAYVVALGRDTPVPEDTVGETVYLAVELDGKEIVRQPIKPKVVGEHQLTAALPSMGGQSDYAERCGDSTTVGGFSPEDFAPASMEEKLDKHIKNRSIHGGGGGGGTLGAVQKTDYAGGTGGKVYSLSCPAGYVVTGVEGRSGAVLDSIRLICTELE